MPENVDFPDNAKGGKDKDPENLPTDSSESDGGAESSEMISEASTSRASPGSGQGSLQHSPDSTMDVDREPAQSSSTARPLIIPVTESSSTAAVPSGSMTQPGASGSMAHSSTAAFTSGSMAQSCSAEAGSMAQSCSAAAITSGSMAQSCSVEPDSSGITMAHQNPLLVKALKGELPMDSPEIKGKVGMSSGQQLPDSPSRRKREGAAPTEPPFSPTKKLKSPAKGKSPKDKPPKKDDDKSPKKDKSPPKDDKK